VLVTGKRGVIVQARKLASTLRWRYRRWAVAAVMEASATTGAMGKGGWQEFPAGREAPKGRGSSGRRVAGGGRSQQRVRVASGTKGRKGGKTVTVDHRVGAQATAKPASGSTAQDLRRQAGRHPQAGPDRAGREISWPSPWRRSARRLPAKRQAGGLTWAIGVLKSAQGPRTSRRASGHGFRPGSGIPGAGPSSSRKVFRRSPPAPLSSRPSRRAGGRSSLPIRAPIGQADQQAQPAGQSQRSDPSAGLG